MQQMRQHKAQSIAFESGSPFALRREAAASFCGVSVNYFSKLVSSRVLPQPRMLGPGVKAWLKSDLADALLSLPTDEEATDFEDFNPCDRLLESE